MCDSASHIEAFAKFSGSLDDIQKRAMRRGCEIAKSAMAKSLDAAVLDAGGRPMLNAKSGDSTPVTVTVRAAEKLPCGEIVRASGRERVDYYTKNELVRYVDAAGEMQTRALIQEPLAMTKGKTVLHQFSLCRRDWKTLRGLGHLGVAIEHYCFDRLSFDSLESTWRTYHSHLSESYAQLAEQARGRLGSLP